MSERLCLCLCSRERARARARAERGMGRRNRLKTFESHLGIRIRYLQDYGELAGKRPLRRPHSRFHRGGRRADIDSGGGGGGGDDDD